MWIELVELTALLLALTMLLSFIFRTIGKDSAKSRFVQGILFGLIAVVGMSIPVNFSPGVIFDPRSVIVTISGFFGGPFAALPSILIAGGYRYSLGGAGALAGTLVVILSTLTGLAGYYLRQRNIVNTSPLHLFLVGLISHFIAMFGMLALPASIMWNVVQNLSIPFFIIYPPVTIFLGYLLADIEHKFDLENKLKESTAQLRSLFDTTPNLIWLKDPNGKYLMCNQRFEEFTGLDEKDIQGKTDKNFFNIEQADIFRANDLKAISTGKEIICEEYATSVNAETSSFFEVTKAPVYDSDKKLLGVLGVAHDITRRSENEAKLKQSATVFESAQEGVFITDQSNKILDVNQSVLDITGYSREELIGQNPSIFSSGQNPEDFYTDMWKSLSETGQWCGEVLNKRKDGSLYPQWLTISSVQDKEGLLANYVAVFSDITEKKQSQSKLDFLAHHDSLTSLPNRLLLGYRLDQALSHAKRHNSQLAILFIDLDRFKNINDSFGHKAGDDLLTHVANSLKEKIREEDTLARISGDEFIVLLEEIESPESVVSAVEKIMNALSNPLFIEGYRIQTSASIGISMYPLDGENAVDLLRNADAAMYRAKEEGGNTYEFYTHDLTQKAFDKVIMENELRDALRKDELYLAYQPQIDLASKRLIGLEALLRWKHPRLENVSPDQFIPLAENSGLINPIGKWVMKEACLQGKQWLDNGFDFGKIAVNISGVQINKGELLDTVSNVLNETGLPSACLELEVTESTIMKQPESSIIQLNSIRDLGVSLSIDDFGTGYSSLSYLKSLPIHKLKIDRSFIRDILDDKDDKAIVEAIIAMGSSLDMTVIAEGVEFSEQEKLLQESGCHEAQGFLYGKPVSADKLQLNRLTRLIGKDLSH